MSPRASYAYFAYLKTFVEEEMGPSYPEMPNSPISAPLPDAIFVRTARHYCTSEIITPMTDLGHWALSLAFFHA